MRYLQKIPTLFTVIVSLALFVLAGCDGGPGTKPPKDDDDNQPPTANLSANPADVTVDDTVQLDASGSNDPDGDNLSFRWSMDAPDGSAVSLDSDSSETSFVADVSGEFVPEVSVSDGNGGSDTDNTSITAMQDEPDEVTVATEILNKDGNRIDTARIAYAGSQAGTGYVQKTYEMDASKNLDIQVGGNGLTQADTSVSLGSNHSLEFVLQKEAPKQVTVSFENRAADGDSLVAGDIQLAGELKASDAKSGSFTTAGSRASKQLCFTEGEFFKRYCQTISLMKDQSVELFPERKEVTVATTPVGSTGMILPEALVFVGPDSVEITGDGSIKRPKRSGTRTIVGDWITEETDSDKLNRYRSQPLTVSAAENIDRKITIDQLIPACSDGIDNDGDGFADKADVRACATLDGEYDPQDDNEILKAVKRSSSVVFDDSTFVSGQTEKRVARIAKASNPMPPSAQAAKDEVEVFIEVKQSADTSGEDYAIHIKAGPSNDNLTKSDTTEVVLDDDSRDGWYFLEAVGIQGEVFRDGPHYAVYAWDDTKALGQPPADDGVRVYFFAEQQKIRSHSITYVFEPEDVPDTKRSKTLKDTQATTLERGECVDRANNTVCRVPAGSSKF
jgi:hypothetical protein